MYDKVLTNRNVVEHEKAVEQFWKDNDIFKKSMENRKEGETYTFYDGPPTANGKPHIGHVLTRVIKDMIPRYQTMKGKMVPRKAGWDTHGLPVELEVEKMLGLDGKEQIEEYGVESFIQHCKESVWKYKGMWEDFSATVGFWADMDDPYVTYHDTFIESEWWALKKIWDKKLLYKGYKIVPYCPRCGTPLSSHEVAQGYKDVKERSATARFKVVGEDAYFLAWTTTPWTLPSNVALCVNPDETYVKVKMKEEDYVYYLAQALADTVLGEGTYEILETYKGKDLEYKEYEALYPAQFISEAVDQTRGWFYSLMAISTLLFNKAPFENVIVLGHVQDENGQKMSKSKGNAVDPFDALSTYGADAIRWYFYINSAPWLPNRFHGKAVQEGQNKFLGTLWNTYAFFVLYANIDNFNPMNYTLDYDKLPVMDKWLLSKMNSMVKAVDDNLGNYRIPEAARALEEFVDDMSNWYVRRSRERFWAKGMEEDKVNAYMTLYTALVTVCKAAAPMIPFMTEEIYRNIVVKVDPKAPESIHLCDFPAVEEAHIDKKLESEMDEVLKVVVLGRACRNKANIKNRQPIAKMYVKAPEALPEYFAAIIRDELNVKEVAFTDDVSGFISYSFKPQMRTVGPKYGKLLGKIRQMLPALDGAAAMNELKTTDAIHLDVDGTEVVLGEEDLLIETAQTEGCVSEANGEVSVVLDTNLTPELIEEGLVRELVSKIQTMRKEAGFEVMDKITVSAMGNDKIDAILKKYESEIRDEVLAVKVEYGIVSGYSKEWSINGETVTLGVEKQ